MIKLKLLIQVLPTRSVFAKTLRVFYLLKKLQKVEFYDNLQDIVLLVCVGINPFAPQGLTSSRPTGSSRTDLFPQKISCAILIYDNKN